MIAVDSLTKTFGTHHAVRDMSFVAPAGKVTGLLGPNGAGKTTTFRTMLGLARPTSGTVTINGVPYDQLERPREHVGAVLESSGFHPSRRAQDHLRVITTSAGLPERRIHETLELVGLAAVARNPVGEFSMGMRQRLALASALLGDPSVLILDEPTNGLDPQGITWLRTLIRQWADDGRTLLVSSHLLAEIGQIVDHVVIIATGQVRYQGPPPHHAGNGRVVTITTPAPGDLIAALQQAGTNATPVDQQTVTATDIAPHEIGRIAGAAHIAIDNVTTHDAIGDLETLFLSLTDPDGTR